MPAASSARLSASRIVAAAAAAATPGAAAATPGVKLGAFRYAYIRLRLALTIKYVWVTPWFNI